MQKILKDSTQTLVSYPRVSVGGRPLLMRLTSPYVRIHTPASVPATVDTWASATTDTVYTTLSAAVSEGATSFALTDVATTVAGRRYLLVDNNTAETSTIESAVSLSDDVFVPTAPMSRDVASGTLLRGFAVYKALTAAQTATCGECIAIWKATDGTNTYQWSQPFQIVRRMPVWDLTPSSLASDYPIIMSSRNADDLDLEAVINAALKHEILPLLHARGIAEENIISTEELEPLHALACVLSVLRQRPDTDETYFQRMQARYDQLKESVFASSRWYELNQQIDPPILPTEQQANQQGNGIRISR